MTTTTTNPEIIGPYSPWPRQEQKSYRRPALFAATAAAAGIFAHCILPMLT